MTKQLINPSGITEIMGAYSLSVKVDIGDSEIIFLTGQMAMDKNGKAVASGNFGKQAEFIFKNISRILKAGGASINDVVKAVIYITDMRQFKEFSAVRNKYFDKARPVSTLVEVSKLSKEGCDIEIDVTAIKQK